MTLTPGAGGGRCDGEPFDQIDKLVGDWQGELDLSRLGMGIVQANMRAYRILGGCTVIRFLDFALGDERFRQFELLTWNASRQKFEALRLDNLPDKPADLFYGTMEDNTMTLLSETQTDGKPLTLRHQWIFNEDGTLGVASATKSGAQAWQPGATGKLKRKTTVDNVSGDQSD